MEHIQTNLCYIATLDLLGIKNVILSDMCDEHLNHIRTIYKSWLRIKENMYGFEKLQTKIFSDNIAIVIDVNEPDAIYNLLEYVAYMAEHLLACGYKVRGAITKGQVYIDDVLIWGEGLVRAYLLESKEALYPRIILDSNLIDDIPSKNMNEVIEFSDDYHFINYLKWYGKNKDGYLQTIDKALNLLESEQNISDKRVIEKNNWFYNYLIKNKEFYLKKPKE